MDLSGQIFGKLTAVSRVGSGGSGSGGMWICRCKCGNTRILSASELQHGRVKSCGLCSRAEDLTGRRYGRLLVLEQAEPLLSSCRKRPQWLSAWTWMIRGLILSKAVSSTQNGRRKRPAASITIWGGQSYRWKMALLTRVI